MKSNEEQKVQIYNEAGNREEVIKIIKSLNNSSLTGIDFIDAQTIKLVKYEIVKALTKIINLSIETETFQT